jgi:ubiquinone/menaquinone biosynthesis C-methylase UbiE
MADIWEAERPEDYLTRLAASDLGRAYKSLVIDELGIEQGGFVVDLGCGPGADLAGLAGAVGPAGRVLGIDIDASAVAEAARVASECPSVRVEHGDIHHLELADQSVDRVHTDRVLQHVADPDAVVAEVARVLRPGGVAGFAEPDWDTLVVDYPDPAIPVAYRRFITDEVVRNSRIGRQMPALCERNRLTVTRVIPVTAVFRDVAQADRILGFQRVTDRAVDSGYLAPEDGAAWLTHLRTVRLFASVTLFVTLAEDQSQG